MVLPRLVLLEYSMREYAEVIDLTQATKNKVIKKWTD